MKKAEHLVTGVRREGEKCERKTERDTAQFCETAQQEEHTLSRRGAGSEMAGHGQPRVLLWHMMMPQYRMPVPDVMQR